MRRGSYALMLTGKNALLREGLSHILSKSGFHIASSVMDAQDIDFDGLERDRKSLLVMTMDDAEAHSLVQKIKQLKGQRPSQLIVVLASHYRSADAVALFQAGVSACLIQTMNSDVLIKSIELIMLGESLVPFSVLPCNLARQTFEDQAHSRANEIMSTTDLAQALPNTDVTSIAESDSGDAPRLSPCEQRVLSRLMAGDSNKAIARTINIAEATVKAHLKSILRKIKLNNRTQAAIWAMNNLSQAAGDLVNMLDHAANVATDEPASLCQLQSERISTSLIGSPPLALGNSQAMRRQNAKFKQRLHVA